MATKQNKVSEGPAESAGPRIPRRAVWLDVPEYPGFKVKIWSNMPKRVQNDFESGDYDLAMPAVLQIVLEHNGWCDESGEPYPEAQTEEFWAAIPQELARVVIGLVSDGMNQLPNSLRAKRRI